MMGEVERETSHSLLLRTIRCNSVIYSYNVAFRFNLYEEEIKTDLESLRNTTNPNPIVKKIKKIPSPVQSKFNSALLSEEKVA